MLEDDYSKLLTKLLEACECDLAVPSEWQDSLGRRGIISTHLREQRRFVRHRWSDCAVLEYNETFSSIPRAHTTAQVVTRDISQCGIAFLHSDQLFPGERISLWLAAGKRSFVVQRCVQHNENCFEIGADDGENGTKSAALACGDSADSSST
jgi:hypothetical protein